MEARKNDGQIKGVGSNYGGLKIGRRSEDKNTGERQYNLVSNDLQTGYQMRHLSAIVILARQAFRVTCKRDQVRKKITV